MEKQNPSQEKRRAALSPKETSREAKLAKVKRKMVLKVKESRLDEYKTHAVCKGCNKGFPMINAKRNGKSPVCPKCGSDKVEISKKKHESRSLTILNQLFEEYWDISPEEVYTEREGALEEFNRGYDAGYALAEDDWKREGDADSLPKPEGSKDYVEGFRTGWREFWYTVSESVDVNASLKKAKTPDADAEYDYKQSHQDESASKIVSDLLEDF